MMSDVLTNFPMHVDRWGWPWSADITLFVATSSVNRKSSFFLADDIVIKLFISDFLILPLMYKHKHFLVNKKTG